LLHPPHTFGHTLFGVAERNTQKSFRLVAEGYAGNGNDSMLQKLFCDLYVIA
jgi:hypothetical protein